MRKLSEYYKFKIVINPYLHFTDMKEQDLPDYKRNLTKGQWEKASQYLTRKLIPFCGYEYYIKPEYKTRKVITIV